MPRLEALLEGLGARIRGDPAAPVAGLCYDSRRVAPGALFVALRGTAADGHRFIPEAIAAGAGALLVERLPREATPVPVAVVSDTRSALAEVAARFYGYPAEDLTLVGVTGTNGKTSTVRMIEAILTRGGCCAGSLGTISLRYPGVEEAAALTTPESADLQRTLARLRDAGVDAVAIEISSHSLALGRVRTLRFAAAVFTQLSQDHLDFHNDLETYGDAKALLFEPEYLDGTAVLNAHDALTPRLAEIAHGAGRPVLSYGRGKDVAADLRTVEEDVQLAGARIVVEHADRTHTIRVPLPGDFQIENALAAIGAGVALELPWDAISEGIESCPAIPGRLERVAAGKPTVLVDYAHTPHALDRVLGRMRPLVQGRLICVFGCGGDRDRTKRAPMARAACRHSDLVLATSDNPRSENPDAILRDVAAGLSGAHEIVVDRREAIRRAVALAEPEDVVVIAGKGHEDYQIVGSERRPFDDRREARAALVDRGGAS